MYLHAVHITLAFIFATILLHAVLMENKLFKIISQGGLVTVATL